MKKILYIEPRQNEKRYLYYTYIGKELQKYKTINLIIGDNLDKYQLNDFHLIILGYGACATNFCTTKEILNTKTPIIAFLFKLGVNKEHKFSFLKNNNIIIFGQQYRIPEFEKKYKVSINKTLYPFNNNLFHNQNLQKIYDISITGAKHDSKHYIEEAFLKEEHNLRERIINKLKPLNIKTFINCTDINKEAYIEDINEYIKIINQSKFWICVSADHGDLTPRFCEIICCKTLIFCNEHNYSTFNDLFIDGETCVIFKNDLSDFESKINFYLNNPNKCKEMADKMYEIYNNNYSIDKTVNKMLSFIN